MVTLNEAQSQINAAKQDIQSRQQEASQAQANLEAQKLALPNLNTSSALLSSDGLQGLRQRQQVEQAKQDIQSQQEDITNYSNALSDFQTTQLAPAESKLKDIQLQQEAADIIDRAASKDNVWAFAAYGDSSNPYVKKYAKEYIKNRTEARADFRQSVSDFETKNPTEKLVFDLNADSSGYKVVGVQDISKVDTISPTTNNVDISKYLAADTSGKTYSPELGGFISTSPTGAAGTAYITPATAEQKIKLEGNNILTTSLPEIRRRYAESEKISLDLSALGNKNINATDNTWIGSQEDYTKYKELQKNLEANTIGVGLFNPEQQPISNFRYLAADNSLSVAGALPRVVGETAAVNFGQLGGLLPNKDVTVVGASNYTTSLPYQLAGTSFQKDGKFYAPVTKIESKDVTINPSKVGKSVGQMFGRATPYIATGLLTGGLGAEALFAGEQAGLFAGETELSGGNLVKGGLGYVSRYGTEGAILAAGLALETGGFLAKAGKMTKYSKYIDNKELNVMNLEARPIINEFEPQARVMPKVSISQSELGTEVNILNKEKGAVKKTEIYPSNEYTGKGTVTRWLGDISISSKGIAKKLKTFTSDVVLSDKYFKESVDFGKYTRVTEMSNGEGSIKLIDKSGNEIYSKTITPKTTGLMKNIKTIGGEFELEGQVNNPIRVIEVNGQKRLLTRQGDVMLNPKGEPITQEPNLGATMSTGKFKKEAVISGNQGKSVVQRTENTYFSTDIIQTEARQQKAMLQNVNIEGQKITQMSVKERAGQTIKIGEDIELDTSKVKSQGKEFRLVKKISPEVNRDITEGITSKITRVSDTLGNKKLSSKINLESAPDNTFKELSARIDKVNRESAKASSELLKDQIGKSKSFQLKALTSGGSEEALPSYVGGAGGEASASRYKFNPDFMRKVGLDQIDTEVTVKPTEAFLKGQREFTSSVNNLEVPAFSTAKPSEAILTRGSTKSIERTQTALATTDVNLLKSKNSQVQQPKSNTRLNNKVNSLLVQSQPVIEQQQFKFTQQLKQQPSQTPQFREVTKQETNQVTQPDVFTPEVPTNSEDNLFKRVKKKLKAQPDIFEATIKKKGKEVTLGKFGTKQEAETSLLKSLKGTLAASGRIKQGGKPLSLGQLDMFNTGEFTPSKKDSTFIVQKKTARFGTKQETQEVQYFRSKAPKKSRKSKGFSF